MDQMVRDGETVTAAGENLAALPAGVSFKDVATQVDDRGSLCEMYDERWDWHPDALVYAYFMTVRPGVVKGWAMHETHEDRYFVMSGDLEVVLYDARDDSPTKGLVSKIYFTPHRRRLMNVPVGVWHAVRNIGTQEAVIVNFPTAPYNHADPDKYRLPIDTDQIPHSFDDARGG